jgi:hypothetical protein
MRPAATITKRLPQQLPNQHHLPATALLLPHACHILWVPCAICYEATLFLKLRGVHAFKLPRLLLLAEAEGKHAAPHSTTLLCSAAAAASLSPAAATTDAYILCIRELSAQ